MNRSLILLSAQRALLGAVTSNMRGITIGYNEKSLTLRVYFYSQPSDEELELLAEITSEVAADIPDFKDFKEEAIVLKSPDAKVEKLDEWIYLQYTTT